MAFGAGFEDTAFIFRAGLFNVFAGQVDFNPSEIGVKSLQEVVDIGSDGIGELTVH